ncbi:MAG TPA: hypothetical protein VL329_11655 [Nitrospiraceae bacterium]|nr:hypothetical protein [Nitrospiraceae bacterium]
MSINDSRITNNEPSFPALDVLLFLFFINLALQPLVEPDFGWHLRTGIDLLHHGWRMPLTDPYSHTMPEWPWVEHAWLTDGLIGVIYTNFGTAGGLGVILFFASVIAGAFLLASAPAHAGRTARIVAVALAAWIALPFLGARIQMVTLLGLALLLWLWKRYQWQEIANLWIVPPLFLLWANLHGGFTAGLFTCGLLLTVAAIVRLVADARSSIVRRLDEPVLSWSQIRHMVLIFGLAVPLTFINPYGWRLYAEIVQSLDDRFMIETLQEWQPVSVSHRAGLTYVFYLAGLALTMLCFYRRIEPTRWAVLGIFLALSLRHWRNVPFFLLVSIPLAAEMVQAIVGWIVDHVPAFRHHMRRWLFGVTVAVGAGIVLLGSEHLERVAQSGLDPTKFFETTEYPIEAVQWIQAHRSELGARLYNDYGFGGFLLWWLPDEKIFIDGRMPAWRIGDRWIFYDYMALTSWGPPALGVLDKYAVDWAMTAVGGTLDRELNEQTTWQVRYADHKVRIYGRTRD